MSHNDNYTSGLEGVTAARTKLSYIDGEEGVLIFRGHPVEKLARDYSYGEVCRLLWAAKSEDVADLSVEKIERELARGRRDAYERLPALGFMDELGDGMQALQAAVATIELTSDGKGWRRAARLTGAVPAFAAAWWHLKNGREPIEPDPTLGHVADALRMATGQAPDAESVDGLRTYMVSVADHGLNASTFTARVIASTQSSLPSAISGAIGALKGPLHGGAPGPVLEMLDEIGSPERAESWITDKLEAGERIMGMGHRVYRTKDPRAKAFEAAAERMAASREDVRRRLELAREVEDTATELLEQKKPGLELHANVEFYTAVLLDATGLPPELFTLFFASGRTVGWCAHVLEHWERERLVRPRAQYDGPK